MVFSVDDVYSSDQCSEDRYFPKHFFPVLRRSSCIWRQNNSLLRKCFSNSMDFHFFLYDNFVYLDPYLFYAIRVVESGYIWLIPLKFQMDLCYSFKWIGKSWLDWWLLVIKVNLDIKYLAIVKGVLSFSMLIHIEIILASLAFQLYLKQ